MLQNCLGRRSRTRVQNWSFSLCPLPVPCIRQTYSIEDIWPRLRKVVRAGRYCGSVSSRLNQLIIHLIWGIGGLILGACIALLVVKNWTSDWVEATGTWFGAVATVLTLLWAVRSFRSDQAERENTRKAEHEKEKEEQSERERAVSAEAGNVSISLQGGAGQGSPPNQMMTSVHVVIRNLSKNIVVIRNLSLDERLKPRNPLPVDIPIPAGEEIRRTIEIDLLPAVAEEGTAHVLVDSWG